MNGDESETATTPRITHASASGLRPTAEGSGIRYSASSISDTLLTEVLPYVGEALGDLIGRAYGGVLPPYPAELTIT